MDARPIGRVKVLRPHQTRCQDGVALDRCQDRQAPDSVSEWSGTSYRCQDGVVLDCAMLGWHLTGCQDRVASDRMVKSELQ